MKTTSTCSHFQKSVQYQIGRCQFPKAQPIKQHQLAKNISFQQVFRYYEGSPEKWNKNSRHFPLGGGGGLACQKAFFDHQKQVIFGPKTVFLALMLKSLFLDYLPHLETFSSGLRSLSAPVTQITNSMFPSWAQRWFTRKSSSSKFIISILILYILLD